ERRNGLISVWIVREEWCAARGQASAHHPIVASDGAALARSEGLERILQASDATGRRLIVSRRRDHIARLKANRRMIRSIEIENRRREQSAIDRRVERQIGIARMEIGDALHGGRADRGDGATVVPFVLEVSDEGLVARDHDRRRPPPWSSSQYPEL